MHLIIEMEVSSTISTPKGLRKKIAKIVNAPKDVLVADLGCGNALTLIEIVRHNQAKGVGFELSPIMGIIAKFNALISKPKVKVEIENFLTADYNGAEIFFLNLPQKIIDLFEPRAKMLLDTGVKIYLLNSSFKNLKPIKEHELDGGKRLVEF